MSQYRLVVRAWLRKESLAWKIPRTEEPGRLQSMGHRHNYACTHMHTHTLFIELMSCDKSLYAGVYSLRLSIYDVRNLGLWRWPDQ